MDCSSPLQRRAASRRWSSRLAFTLVELLVVIAIIGVLVALLLPAVQAAREAARRSQCTNNLKQIALGCINYEGTHKRLPRGSSFKAIYNVKPGTTDPKPGTWVTEILPFIEAGNVSDAINFDRFMDDPTRNAGGVSNLEIAQTTILPVFICPSDPVAQSPILENRRASGHNPTPCQGLWYKGSMGPTIPDTCAFIDPKDQAFQHLLCMGANYGSDKDDGSFEAPCYSTIKGGSGSRAQPCPDKSRCVGAICRNSVGTPLRKFTDGTTNTYLLGETLPTHSTYNSLFAENFPVGSTHIPLNEMDSDEVGTLPIRHWTQAGFKSSHIGIIHFAMTDGSVQGVNEETDKFVYNAFGTRAGGETVTEPN
jgi:prepilin-type N-terminal cleavage/methylation domain-containing protein